MQKILNEKLCAVEKYINAEVGESLLCYHSKPEKSDTDTAF